MGKNRRHLAAVACVLLLNLQLFAANALGCIHQAQPDGSVPATGACPHLSGFMTQAASGDAASVTPAGGDTPDAAAAEPCQKCNLGKVAGGWHLVGVQAQLLAHAAPAPPTPAPAIHLSSRCPDGLLRPPRSISG
ncbi:hypothetical protein [Thiohalocapsa sp.]|jgi:hypothetical protein|uniref:hypothetical protein n=1 Tax=Thiohalocapsa sp. TaxID=2497641 RepID=UPI0025DA70D9|nr:hypothetical protein [Thiohalocapsa sp.]